MTRYLGGPNLSCCGSGHDKITCYFVAAETPVGEPPSLSNRTKTTLYPGPQNSMLMGGPNLLFCGAGEDKITRYLEGLTYYSVGPATAK